MSCLMKILNAFRPSEHPPVRGGNDKTFRWDQRLQRQNLLIEFRCVVTVSTPAVWLARENIKRLTPRPCINVEYSHRVVYIEEEWRPVGSFLTSDQLSSIPIIYIPNPFST